MNNNIAAVFIIIFTILHITIAYDFNKRSIENEYSLATRDVANGVNQFSIDFDKVIFRDESQKNMVCSTLSVAMVLMMAAYGAAGKTLQQMNKVLHINADNNIYKNGIDSLISQLNAVKSVQLHLANKIYIKSGLDIKPDFRTTTATIFHSEIQNLNFSNSVIASQEINDWCEKQTHSRIKDIVEPNEFTEDTALVLVNAVYFKGNWAKKFNVNNTKLRTFYRKDNTTAKVPMMHNLGKYRYGELPELSARFLELPYESTETNDVLSMFIVLPNKVDGLETIEENLHKMNFSQLLLADLYDVDLLMPKFKIESKIDLKLPLSELGMEDIFGNNANFTGIIDQPSLKVSKIVQKAFIEVNEEGSEAAAVTGLQFSTFSMPIISDFHIDHPFYYSIVKLKVDDDNSGVILFQGHCVDIE